MSLVRKKNPSNAVDSFLEMGDNLKIGNYSAYSKKNIVMNNFSFVFLEK